MEAPNASMVSSVRCLSVTRAPRSPPPPPPPSPPPRPPPRPRRAPAHHVPRPPPPLPRPRPPRHGRALTRPSAHAVAGVDGRVKPVHDVGAWGVGQGTWGGDVGQG